MALLDLETLGMGLGSMREIDMSESKIVVEKDGALTDWSHIPLSSAIEQGVAACARQGEFELVLDGMAALINLEQQMPLAETVVPVETTQWAKLEMVGTNGMLTGMLVEKGQLTETSTHVVYHTQRLSAAA